MNLRKWRVLVSLLLMFLAVWLPLFKISLDVPTLLSVLSFLFAILVGFFIATATANYLRLQALIAEEDAGLITIFNLVRNIAPKDLEKITDAIDNYAIAALSFELTEYVSKTDREFEGLATAADEINFTDEKRTGAQRFSTRHKEWALFNEAGARFSSSSHRYSWPLDSSHYSWRFSRIFNFDFA